MQYVISIDFSNFNASSVIYMSYMFRGCNSLESLDLSNFDTSSVITMSYMLYGCNLLESLDLSNFDTSSVIYMFSLVIRPLASPDARA